MSENDKQFKGINIFEEERKREIARAQSNDQFVTNKQMMEFMNDLNPEEKFRLNTKYIYTMMHHDASSMYQYDVEDARMDARALLDLLYQYYNAIGMSGLIAELYHLDKIGYAEYDPLTVGGRIGGRGRILHKHGTKEDQERAEKFADLWSEAIYRRHDIAEKETSEEE